MTPHQEDLFSVASLAASVTIPPAPALVLQDDWPFPGSTTEDTARARIANSPDYVDMLANVVRSLGPGEHTQSQVKAAIPPDWHALLGRYIHASICHRHGAERGIQVRYAPHDNGGFHFTYRVAEATHP